MLSNKKRVQRVTRALDQQKSAQCQYSLEIDDDQLVLGIGEELGQMVLRRTEEEWVVSSEVR